MKIKKKSKSRRIREAAIRDGISFIVGYSPVPVPLETIKELMKIKKEKSPVNFVDWELEEWPFKYINKLTQQ